MKTILITGSTDGIGLVTAQTLATHYLAKESHHLLVHGRSADKLAKLVANLKELNKDSKITPYQSDLSVVEEVKAMVTEIKDNHQHIDVIINNAGVFKTNKTLTNDNLDIRFMVNTIAPYIITQSLTDIMDVNSRVINLSSAAQQSLSPNEITANATHTDNQAYAKSKLAITMWSKHLAKTYQDKGPMIVAVNPASMLGSKMVKDAYGVSGGDIQIGADILIKAALSDEFANANGLYFDNDNGRFTNPHPDALDESKNAAIVSAIEGYLAATHTSQ